MAKHTDVESRPTGCSKGFMKIQKGVTQMRRQRKPRPLPNPKKRVRATAIPVVNLVNQGWTNSDIPQSYTVK